MAKHLEERRRRDRRVASATRNHVDHQRHWAGTAGPPGSRRAGLDRINVSLDTVDAEHFARITRRDRLADVLAGLAAAQAARA